MPQLKHDIKAKKKEPKENKSYYLKSKTIKALEKIYTDNQDQYKSVSALLQTILDNSIDY